MVFINDFDMQCIFEIDIYSLAVITHLQSLIVREESTQRRRGIFA